MNKITVLCIGGLHDGERVVVDKINPMIRLRDSVDLPTITGPIMSVDVAVSSVTHSDYFIEQLRGANRIFYIGRPQHQDLDSTMAMLVHGYRGV